jgi:thioredoxin-like negative regulator of GroEL
MAIDSGDSSNAPNLEQLMQIGIQTARKGNKPNARMIFQQILDADKQNERAWLWMAAVAETPMDRVRYLRTVLQINPGNTTALRELEKLQQKRESNNSQVIRYGAIAMILVFVLVAFALLVLIIL